MINYFYTDNEGYITIRGNCVFQQDIPSIPNETLNLGIADEVYNYYIDNKFIYKPVYEIEAAKVKSERYTRLVATDWTQLPDVPVEDKQAWADYRQQLRDITSQSGYPFNIVWPIKP